MELGGINMKKQAKLQKNLSKLQKDLDAMKKYVTSGYFGTVESMIFTMQADLTKTYSFMLQVEEEQKGPFKTLNELE
jgi:uncharacterized membrane-anchored protein YhcB (DUF1043 family)